MMERNQTEQAKSKSRSRSKTFPVKSDYGELYTFIRDQIETADREVITFTPPSYDIVTETKHKYIITITKIES